MQENKKDNVISLSKDVQLTQVNSQITSGQTSNLYNSLTCNSGSSFAVGQAGSLLNAAQNSITLGNYYPYYSYPYYTYNHSKDVVIRKVENGWVVTKNYKEYIAKNEKDLVKILLKEEIKGK